jgi:hypothetical protein
MAPAIARLAILLFERGQLRPHGEKHAHQIDIDDLARHIEGRLGQKHQIVNDTGIVDSNIQPAEPRKCPVDQPFGKLRLADVPGAGLAFALKFGCKRLKPICVEIA